MPSRRGARPRRAAKRARPCAAPLPGRSTGGHRRTCSSSGWAIPEPEFAGSLHNAGSDTVELLAQRHGASLRAEKGVQARPAVVTLAGRRVALAVPTTYMNDSGSAVRSLATRFGIDEPASVVIVHDELDLPPGTVRLKAGGGLAGHNGLRSVQSHLHSAGLPAGAHRGRQAARARPRARRTCCSRPPKAVRELLAASRARSRPTPSSALPADGMDAAMLWCHSLPT